MRQRLPAPRVAGHPARGRAHRSSLPPCRKNYAENSLQNFLCNSTVVGMQTCEHPPRTGTPPVAGTPPHPGIRHHCLGRLVALAVGAFLLPWCAVLGATLPASAHVPNWSLAWVGLDLAEAVAALL